MLVVLIFGGVAFLLTIASGWRTLSSRFPSVAQFEGERFHFVSAKMGRVPWFLVNYGGFLVLTVAADGLVISAYWPFRILCPELFVPWAQIEGVEERASALSRRTVVRFLGTPVRLSIRGTPGLRVASTFSRINPAGAAGTA